MNDDLISESELIGKIYSYGPTPLTGFNEIREKYTFNIKPFQLTLNQNNSNVNEFNKKNKKDLNSNNSNNNENEELNKIISCFALLQTPLSKKPQLMFNTNESKSTTSTCPEYNGTCSATLSSLDISMLSPGAFSFIPYKYSTPKDVNENYTMDINELKKQYRKLKQRQQQAQITIQTASEIYRNKNAEAKINENSEENKQPLLLIDSNHIYNHLLIKPESKNKNSFKVGVIKQNQIVDESKIVLNEFPQLQMINSENSEKKTKQKELLIQDSNKNKNHKTIINPFQIKPINSMVAKNGIRLGLYK